MSDRQSELKKLRGELEDRHAELARRVEAITSDLRQESRERSDDWDDRAAESENDSVLTQLDDAGRDEIQQIEIALRRLEAGTYGICADCEDEIPIARLRAVPSALRCVACESRAEG